MYCMKHGLVLNNKSALLHYLCEMLPQQKGAFAETGCVPLAGMKGCASARTSFQAPCSCSWRKKKKKSSDSMPSAHTPIFYWSYLWYQQASYSCYQISLLTNWHSATQYIAYQSSDWS